VAFNSHLTTIAISLIPETMRHYNASCSQASLPVRWGGVGVRSVADLAPSAYLASFYLVRPIVTSILQPIALASFDTSLSTALAHWSSKCGLPPPSESLRSIQRAWDDAVCSTKMESLLASATGADCARLLASGSPGSGT